MQRRFTSLERENAMQNNLNTKCIDILILRIVVSNQYGATVYSPASKLTSIKEI